MIKRCWITEHSRGFWRLCLRYHPRPTASLPSLSCVSPFLLPPTEEIEGRKLNRDEAKERGLLEEPYTIGPFSAEDLVKLRDEIDSKLRTLTHNNREDRLQTWIETHLIQSVLPYYSAGDIFNLLKDHATELSAILSIKREDDCCKEEEEVISDFSRKFLEGQTDCPPEYTKVFMDNIEDILA